MQAAKKFIVWIIIGVIILAALVFSIVHVGARAKIHREENKEIVNSTRMFNNFFSTMREQVPTPKDLEVGAGFLAEITDEGRRTCALWRKFSHAIDKGIVNGEVVYPAEDKQKAGTPVPPKFFTDFLRPLYLQTMVDAELALQGQMVPAWAQMLAQSIYATDYRATEEKAKEEGAASAPAVAAGEAHIFTPNQLIPFKLSDSFEHDTQKRWRYWRSYLIFKDILTRAVAKSVAEVQREVITFDRPPADFDETTGKLGTNINRAKSLRFIENISKLEIRQISIGDGMLPSFDEEKPDTEAQPEIPSTAPNAAGTTANSGHVFYDVFSVQIELTAQMKVIETLAREVPATDEFFYVPVSHEILRLPDSATMGNYTMPNGRYAITPTRSDSYAEAPATPVNPYLAFEREPPVKARLTFHMYRPRSAGTANPEAMDEESEIDNTRKGRHSGRP